MMKPHLPLSENWKLDAEMSLPEHAVRAYYVDVPEGILYRNYCIIFNSAKGAKVIADGLDFKQADIVCRVGNVIAQ